MKRLLVILLSLTLLLACVPTPEEEVVLNKTEGRLEAAITETTPVPAYQTEQTEAADVSTQPDENAQTSAEPTDEPIGTLRAALSAPEHCTDSTEGKVFGGTLTVQIDADVEIPDVSAVPVFTVRDKTFTPEECEHITKLLLGDGPYYNYNRELGEQKFWKRILDQETQRLNDFDNRAYGEDFPYENFREANEFNRNNTLKHYAELPAPGPSQPWTGSFADERVVVADAQNSYLAIGDEEIWLYDEFGSVPEPFDHHAPETAEQEKAMQTAESVFEKLTNERFVASGVGFEDEYFMKSYKLSPDLFPHEDYSVNMVRTVAGIPCYPYSVYHGSDTALQLADVSRHYDDGVRPEHCDVLVRDGRLTAIMWYNMFTVTGTENENVALLPFDDVLNIFKRQIFRSIYLDPAEGSQPETVENMVVERIVLSYMRVKKKDAPNEQYLLPVWDFMGYSYDVRRGETDLFGTKTWFADQSLLTINAIDGSIIDRDAGY